MNRKYYLIGALLLLVTLALAACQAAPAPAPDQNSDAPAATQAPCPTAAPCPDCPACPEPEQPAVEVPFLEAWQGSPHADAEAEAFVHWDEEDPKEVPANCAKCHSTPGYLDFLGVDGTAAGAVDNPAPIGTVVTCVACHNQATATLTTATFPSGAEITGLGASTRCALCHQGRASKVQVDETLANYGATAETEDVVPAPVNDRPLGFINIHYYAAAATLYGHEAMGGYEFDGRAYDGKFRHVEGYDTCTGCHSPHTLEIRIEDCAVCHDGVASVEDLRNIRMAGSLVDYDGDGDVEEGIAAEVTGLQEMLLQAIQAYAEEVAGAPITYDAATYPYFLGADGGYANWTPRLLKAAYNYQTSLKDPGAYAHNAKYIIELLYDSIDVLNEQLSTPVSLESAHRIDAGHFAGTNEAWRHWDEEETGLVPAGCVKCHTAEGLPMFLANNATIAVPPSNGLACATCHNSLEEFTRFEVAEVTFPSGAKLAFDDVDSNLCLNCHQGRESTVSVNRAISTANVDDDTVSEALRFRNPHYFAAGATLFGTDAKGAYEYEGNEYNGRFLHVPAADSCAECHNAHALNVNVEQCAACHGGEEPSEYRMPGTGGPVDYDGDGDTAEGIEGEIATMQELLLAAIQAYAETTAGAPITYDPLTYPYFLNAEGESYASWTPALLRAAYNYQWFQKDPGAFAHNADYALQVLYDSIQAIGGDVTALTRPEVVAPAGE